MSVDSTVFGYLLPTASYLATEDNAIDDILSSFVASITGINNINVRPRWQPNPPKIPEVTENWCAIGVMKSR